VLLSERIAVEFVLGWLLSDDEQPIVKRVNMRSKCLSILKLPLTFRKLPLLPICGAENCLPKLNKYTKTNFKTRVEAAIKAICCYQPFLSVVAVPRYNIVSEEKHGRGENVRPTILSAGLSHRRKRKLFCVTIKSHGNFLSLPVIRYCKQFSM
jgi:hypothetical protein